MLLTLLGALTLHGHSSPVLYLTLHPLAFFLNGALCCGHFASFVDLAPNFSGEGDFKERKEGQPNEARPLLASLSSKKAPLWSHPKNRDYAIKVDESV